MKDLDVGGAGLGGTVAQGRICHDEGNGIGSGVDVRGRGVGEGGSVAVAEVPVHDVVGPCGEVGEPHGEGAATRGLVGDKVGILPGGDAGQEPAQKGKEGAKDGTHRGGCSSKSTHNQYCG